jgi:hypothetical protein
MVGLFSFQDIPLNSDSARLIPSVMVSPTSRGTHRQFLLWGELCCRVYDGRLSASFGLQLETVDFKKFKTQYSLSVFQRMYGNLLYF